MRLPLNSDHEIRLPPATDKEKLPIKISASLADGSSLPPNIIFNDGNNTFQILKTRKTSSYSIKVCLDDNYAPAKCYMFMIKFENIRFKDMYGT